MSTSLPARRPDVNSIKAERILQKPQSISLGKTAKPYRLKDSASMLPDCPVQLSGNCLGLK